MSETIEKTFSVSSPARLVVSNIRGHTEVRAGEEGVIRITAVKHTSSGDPKSTKIEITQEADGTIKAATRFPDAIWSWLTLSFPCRVDYLVVAPRACSLKLSGVSNDTSVQGFEGECSINSVSGEVEVKDLTGPLNVSTVSGEVNLENLAGAVKLHTVSGGIRDKHLDGTLDVDTVSGKVELTASNLASIQTKSVSGNMEIESPLGAGPYHFHSVSGEVRLKVPADTRCTTELHSISGRLDAALPQTSASRHNGTQVAEVQGGGVKVTMNSVSGGLSVKS
jgi:hypothetical protein